MGAALALHFALRWRSASGARAVAGPRGSRGPARGHEICSRWFRVHPQARRRKGIDRISRAPNIARRSRSGRTSRHHFVAIPEPARGGDCRNWNGSFHDTPHPDRRAWSKLRVPTLVSQPAGSRASIRIRRGTVPPIPGAEFAPRLRPSR